jgi:hypothetical protein
LPILNPPAPVATTVRAQSVLGFAEVGEPKKANVSAIAKAALIT